MFTYCGMKFSLEYELGKEFEKYPGKPWEFLLLLSKLSSISKAIWDHSKTQDTEVNMTQHKDTSICDVLDEECQILPGLIQVL